jgi:hypothetical protein
MYEIFVGIDNGITGSIGIISKDKYDFLPVPSFEDREYTKKKQFLHRIDVKKLISLLPANGFILVERPMVNTRAFVSSKSALRALEATMISLELRGYKRGESYDFVDSKDWQKEFFSSAIIGRKELKNASKIIGLKLFPLNEKLINKLGDADGLLIAEYARRKYGR